MKLMVKYYNFISKRIMLTLSNIVNILRKHRSACSGVNGKYTYTYRTMCMIYLSSTVRGPFSLKKEKKEKRNNGYLLLTPTH